MDEIMPTTQFYDIKKSNYSFLVFFSTKGQKKNPILAWFGLSPGDP
jgi:hypothetical protein